MFRALVYAPQTLIWVLIGWPYLLLSIVVCVCGGLVHAYSGRSMRKVSILVALATALVVVWSTWTVFQHCANYAERGFPIDGLGIGLHATFLSLVVTLGAVTSMVMIFAGKAQQSRSMDIKTISIKHWVVIGVATFVLGFVSFAWPFLVCYEL